MKEKALMKFKKLRAERPEIIHDMMLDFIEDMPEEALMLFDKYEHGCHIVSEPVYEKAVGYLDWIGGTGHGAKWTVDDIVSLSGIDFDNKEYTELDYCYIVNMLYSDYCNIFTEPACYLKMAKNYLEDEDYFGIAAERAYKNAKKRIKYHS